MYRFHLGNQNLRRILALTLACLMIFTSLPAGAFRVFAEDEQTEGDAIVETFEETEAGEEDPAPERRAACPGEDVLQRREEIQHQSDVSRIKVFRRAGDVGIHDERPQVHVRRHQIQGLLQRVQHRRD